MTTLRQIELRCPVCDNEFKSQSVVSTNAFGGKRTDFHERAAGTQPLAYLIHMCSECGFSGGEADFTATADVSLVLKQQVLKELAPSRSSLVCGSEKYEAAAKVAQWQGLDPRHIADLLLRAAWCCVDEGDVEAERFFRRHAEGGNCGAGERGRERERERERERDCERDCAGDRRSGCRTTGNGSGGRAVGRTPDRGFEAFVRAG